MVATHRVVKRLDNVGDVEKVDRAKLGKALNGALTRRFNHGDNGDSDRNTCAGPSRPAVDGGKRYCRQVARAAAAAAAAAAATMAAQQ